MKLLFWFVIALFVLPEGSRADFGFHAASHLGYGRLGNADRTIAYRGVSTLDLQFMPGYRVGFVMPGLLIDYRFIGQLGREGEFNNTDYGGKSLLIGLGATADYAGVKALLSYDFRARHTSSRPDRTYKGSGWHFMLGYLFIPNLSIDFAYTPISYDRYSEDELEHSISDNPLTHWNFGMGISYSY